MQTKTYFASSVPAALEVARQDLGEEAMLVSSRPAPPEMRQLGRLEVTFAWDPKDAPAPLAAARPSPRSKEMRGDAVSEMDEIRRQLAALRVAVGGQTAADENNWMAERLI